MAAYRALEICGLGEKNLERDFRGCEPVNFTGYSMPGLHLPLTMGGPFVPGGKSGAPEYLVRTGKFQSP